MNEYTKELRNWMSERSEKMQFVNSLAEAEELKETETNFKVGDSVFFTNDYGFTFGPYTIQGIAKKYDVNGRRIFIDYDCYWFPCSQKNLTLA